MLSVLVACVVVLTLTTRTLINTEPVDKFRPVKDFSKVYLNKTLTLMMRGGRRGNGGGAGRSSEVESR